MPKYQVNEETLLRFANVEIEKFLSATQVDPEMLQLIDYAGNQKKGPLYELMSGNPKPEGSPAAVEAQRLRTEFVAMMKRLQVLIEGFRKTMIQAQIDLIQINIITQNAEDDSTITAQELMTALQALTAPASSTSSPGNARP